MICYALWWASPHIDGSPTIIGRCEIGLMLLFHASDVRVRPMPCPTSEQTVAVQ